MTRQEIINRTVAAINRLPEEKAATISDFADFNIKQYEDHQLTLGIQALAADGDVFTFLNKEDELYTEADLKEKYNN